MAGSSVNAARNATPIPIADDTPIVENIPIWAKLIPRKVIPTVAAATSLNLAQAVLVLGYEIMQVHYQAPSRQGPPLASVDEIEALYDHFRVAFSLHGFSGSHAIERSLMGMRRICERAGLERRDVRLLRGIARQLAWALRHPRHPGGSTP